VGGVIGLAAGAAIAPPPPAVQTYVTQQQIATVAVPGTVTVGTVLPPTVILHAVPNYQYSYAIVNNQGVFVDPADRKVVYLMN
jgi:hypothetical protein